MAGLTEDRPLLESLRAAVNDGFTLVVLNSIAAELSGDVHGQLDTAGALNEAVQ